MDRPPVGSGVSLVARTELRRSWRQIRPVGGYSGLKLSVAGLLLGVYAVILGASGYIWAGHFGGPEGGVPTMARAATAGFFGAIVFLVVSRTVRKNGFPDAGAVLLTTAGHHTIVLGLLLGEIGRFGAILGLPLIGLASGIGLGGGSPAAALAVAVTAGAVLTAGVTVGFGLGLIVKRIATTVGFARRHRTVLALSASMALPVGYTVLLARQQFVPPVLEFLAGAPASWPAELVLFALGSAVASPGRGMVSVVLGYGLPGLAIPVLARLAATTWFADRPETERRMSTRGRSALAQLDGIQSVSQETRAVALKSVRRAIRAPFTVQYATIGAFVLLAELQTIVATGRVPPRLPVIVSLAGAWTAGSLFALNPIGNEGSVLPATITAGPSGREFLGGVLLGSLAIALPPTLLLSLVAGGVAPIGWPVLVVLLLATPLFASGAVGLAAGVGTQYPKLRATTVGRDRSVVIPSIWAFAGFTVLFLLASTPAILIAIGPVTQAATAWSGHEATTIRIVGLLGGTLTLGAAGVVGWRYAARSIETWELE